MVKLKGQFAKTDVGIYDLSGPMGSHFKIVKDGAHASLGSVDNKGILYDVIEVYDTLDGLLKSNQDILEIKEPASATRYAVYRKIVGDKVDTNEGFVDPSYITAVLDYQEWTDTYVRLVFM